MNSRTFKHTELTNTLLINQGLKIEEKQRFKRTLTDAVVVQDEKT